MGRPVLKPALNTADYLIEAAGFMGLIMLFAITIICYDDLPARIPTHFDLKGNPDSYGSRSTLWFLPILGILLFSLLTFLNRYPHIFNYTVEVTENNAARLYLIATRIIRVLKTVIVISLTLLNNRIIMIGLGRADSLSIYFLPAFMMTIFVLIGAGIYTMSRQH